MSLKTATLLPASSSPLDTLKNETKRKEKEKEKIKRKIKEKKTYPYTYKTPLLTKDRL